jgi:DNA-binding response OmpR family regulator
MGGIPVIDGQRILLVEDYSDGAALLHSFLTLKGYDCTVCHDGQAAIEAVDSVRPAALILDVGLPGLSGLEVARTIRARPDGSRFVLVGYSGYGRDEDRQQALEAGMDDFFVKPVDANELLGAIERIAATRETGR